MFHPQYKELWKINVFKCRSGVFYFDPHRVSPFKNIDLFPDLFIFRHYPYREPTATVRRLVRDRKDRMSRWNVENRVSDHYVKYDESDTFVFDGNRAGLQKWSEFRKPKFVPAD